MRRFITKFFIFCLPLLIISLIADIVLSKNFKKSKTEAYGEFSVWNDVYDGKINSDIVVYGSSRAWVHISPKILSDSFKVNAYNLGIDGHNFFLQYFRHTLLLKYNIKPKVIINSLDVFTLQKRNDLYNMEQFLPYMLFNNPIRKITSGYNGFTFFDFVVPALRYMGRREIISNALKSQFSNTIPENFRTKGYRSMDREWNNDFENAKNKMQFYEATLDTNTVHLFEQYLIECRGKGIKIIFVYTPEYIDGQKFVKNRNQIMDVYRSLSTKYNIPFYDYSNDTISYTKKYFYNNEHLNKTGSELFTRRLIGDIKKSNDLLK